MKLVGDKRALTPVPAVLCRPCQRTECRQGTVAHFCIRPPRPPVVGTFLARERLVARGSSHHRAPPRRDGPQRRSSPRCSCCTAPRRATRTTWPSASLARGDAPRTPPRPTRCRRTTRALPSAHRGVRHGPDGPGDPRERPRRSGRARAHKLLGGEAVLLAGLAFVLRPRRLALPPVQRRGEAPAQAPPRMLGARSVADLGLGVISKKKGTTPLWTPVRNPLGAHARRRRDARRPGMLCVRALDPDADPVK